MVEDLLRRFVAKEWSGQLDFSTLERANASFVSEGLSAREGDIAWRVRLRGAPVHLYLLVEFQSRVQRFMALRQSVYHGLFCQQLVAHGQLTMDGKLPPILSVVIYNGKVAWWSPRELSELYHVLCGVTEDDLPRLRYRLLETEAVRPEALRGRNLMALLIRLERARTHSALMAIMPALVDALPGEDDGGLRRAFVVWLQRVLIPGKGEEDIPELVDLKEFRAMLIERVEEWSRKIEARAGTKAQRELLLNLLEVKFGPLLEEIKAMTEFTAVFRRVPEGYIGFVEELPGANTQGATLEEARENLQEAVQLVIEANRAFAEEELGGAELIREPHRVSA